MHSKNKNDEIKIIILKKHFKSENSLKMTKLSNALWTQNTTERERERKSRSRSSENAAAVKIAQQQTMLQLPGFAFGGTHICGPNSRLSFCVVSYANQSVAEILKYHLSLSEKFAASALLKSVCGLFCCLFVAARSDARQPLCPVVAYKGPKY